MIYAMAIRLQYGPLILWCDKQETNIIWDEDMMDDIPTYHLRFCVGRFLHPIFIRGLRCAGLET